MKLSEIKSQLSKESLNLNFVTTEAGEKTSWLKDWNNNSRIAVLMHTDVLAAIKADPNISSLGINTQQKQGKQGEYTAHTICVYKPADVTL